MSTSTRLVANTMTQMVWCSRETAFGQIQDIQPHQSQEPRDAAVFELSVRQSKVRKALNQSVHRNLRLKSSKRCSQTEVRTAAERVMVRVLARDVEAMRIWIHLGIVVRGREHLHE